MPFVVKNFLIMTPLTSTDPETKSPDLAAENLAKLPELFPELVTEGNDGVVVNLDVAHFAELSAHNSAAAQFLKVTKLDDVLSRC